MRLLTTQEQQNLDTETVFAPFKGENSLFFSLVQEPAVIYEISVQFHDLPLVETLNAIFSGLNLYSCGPQTELEWIKSKKQFEHSLQPAEQRVGYKLKKQLSSINANTRQVCTNSSFVQT